MIVLTDAVPVQNLTRLKVQAVKYEANKWRGQEWTEIWCEYGFIAVPGDPSSFTPYPNPATGESLVYFKFENGMHPERPGMMLGRCDTCNVWYFKVNGPCEEQGCEGRIEPFPSYLRFRNVTENDAERDPFKAVEKFLTDTGGRWPNPADRFDLRFLVDGTA